MTNTLRQLSPIALVLVLAGCPPTGGGAPTPDVDAGPGDVERLGQPIIRSCQSDDDCALGSRCEPGGTCRVIDDDADNDGYDALVDCDDADPTINPGAAEVCDDRDQDCDGAIDEGTRNACGQCGDVPAEVCNLLDDDCDGLIDEECAAGAADELEPNDGAVDCQPIALPPAAGETIAIEGAFNPAGDVDSFCFFVRAGTELSFDLDSQVLGAPTDAVLTLFSEAGAQLAFNDFAGGPDPAIRNFVFPVSGTARLDVNDFYADNGGPGHIWKLLITANAYVQCVDGDGDGVSDCDGDCNDADALVFPNQTEVCDARDNDCDADVDEGCPSLVRAEQEPNESMTQCELLTLPFVVDGSINPRRDRDVYCFFAASGAALAFDIDAREPPFGSLLNSRLKLLRSPGTTFSDELAKNDDGIDPETGYTANDSDSFLTFTIQQPGVYAIVVEDENISAGGQRLTYRLGATINAQPPCVDADRDGVTTCEGDCDDTRATVHFGAFEVCDGRDNDCDGRSDPATCTGDFDGDGVSGRNGDCDDDDPTRRPGATEVCNGVDDDCDGAIDEGTRNACGTCGFAPAEQCGNGLDDDCDGVVDLDCDDDIDGDGFTPGSGDCDDTDAAVRPGALELCNGIDDNCDGFIDEFVKNSCGQCGADPVEECNGVDDDCNGLTDDGALNACGRCGPTPNEICNGLDDNCDGETDEGVLNACGACGPVPEERCDGVDNDCDGQTDENCGDDADGDGFSPATGDCDDADATRNPRAEEVCGDAIDQDCDGRPDDGCAPATESEANNTQATCDRIFFPGVVAGTISTSTDVDFYCLTIDVAGTRLGFDVDARDNGSPLDAVLELFGPDGSPLDDNNNNVDPDTGLTTVDPYLSFAFPEPGTYAVKIRAAGTGTTAGASSVYRLDVRVEGGCLDLDGDGFDTCGGGDCDDFNSTIRSGALDICDGLDNDCVLGPDQRCVGSCLDDELEQNDSPAAATVVAGGASLPGLVYCGGDFDFFAIDVATGSSLRVDLIVDGSAVNLGLELIDADGNEVERSNAPSGNESVGVTPVSGGRFFARVFGPFVGEASYELRVVITP